MRELKRFRFILSTKSSCYFTQCLFDWIQRVTNPQVRINEFAIYWRFESKSAQDLPQKLGSTTLLPVKRILASVITTEQILYFPNWMTRMVDVVAKQNQYELDGIGSKKVQKIVYIRSISGLVALVTFNIDFADKQQINAILGLKVKRSFTFKSIHHLHTAD